MKQFIFGDYYNLYIPSPCHRELLNEYFSNIDNLLTLNQSIQNKLGKPINICYTQNFLNIQTIYKFSLNTFLGEPFIGMFTINTTSYSALVLTKMLLINSIVYISQNSFNYKLHLLHTLPQKHITNIRFWKVNRLSQLVRIYDEIHHDIIKISNKVSNHFTMTIDPNCIGNFLINASNKKSAQKGRLLFMKKYAKKYTIC